MKPGNFFPFTIYLTVLVMGSFSFGGCGKSKNISKKSISPALYPFNNPDKEVFETRFGEAIPDPYNWMEDLNDQKVLNWAKKQNQTTFDYISQLSDRIKIYNRLEKLILPKEYKKASREGDFYFFITNEEFPENEVVYFHPVTNKDEKVFINIKAFTGNPNARFASLAVSPDNSMAAFSVQDPITGMEKIFIKKLDDNTYLPDVLPCSFNSSLAWDNQGGFFYSKPFKPEFVKEEIKYAIFYHVPGTPVFSDSPVFIGSDFPEQFNQVSVTSDFRYALITSQKKDKKNQIYYADLQAPPPTPFKKLIEDAGHQGFVIDNLADRFLVQTKNNAPGGRLVLVDPQNTQPEKWKTIISETQDAIKRVYSSNGKFYVHSTLHMSGKITSYDSSGNRLQTIEMPGLGLIEGFACKPGHSDALYTFQSFNSPLAIYRYNFKKNRSEVFKAPEKKINPDDYIIKKEFALTEEGVGIPMLIFQKKSTMNNGKNPLIFSFSGGIDDSFIPAYSTGRFPFVDNGGIYVIAAVRGGRELDENWYEKGRGNNRNQTEKDVRTCINYLIQEKYTSSGKIGMLTKHAGAFAAIENAIKNPGRFKMIAIFQGIMDFTGYQNYNGCTGCIEQEIGNPDQSAETFEWLKNNSPLLRAYQKHDWPAFYLEHKIIDRVISPVHSFKFIAALQDNSKDETKPKLIRIDNECCTQNRRQELFTVSERWALALHLLEMSVR